MDFERYSSSQKYKKKPQSNQCRHLEDIVSVLVGCRGSAPSATYTGHNLLPELV